MMMKRSFCRLVCLTAVLAAAACSAIDESVLPSPSGGEPIASVGFNIGFSDYVYHSLSDTEKLAYDAVLSAVGEHLPYAALPEAMLPEGAAKIYKLVYTQESGVFWLSNIYMKSPEPTDSVKLSYRYSKDAAALMKGELELAAGMIIGGLPPGSTPYDALLYFHDTIIKKCEFSKEGEHVNSAYGALVDGFAQCEGYAFAFSLLCDKAGIENIVVTGKNADGATHAWNKVKLGGDWYNVDLTWNDPIIERKNPDFVKRDYLLLPDGDMLNITHFQDSDLFFPPICGTDKMNYYKIEGLFFTTVDEGIANLSEQIRKQSLAGKREVEVRFSDEVYYQAALTRLFDDKEINDIINTVNSAGGGIKSAYKYTNDELYIIHLSLIFEKD